MATRPFRGTCLQITHFGQTITVAELAARSGLPIWTIYDRYRTGDRDADLVRPKGLRIRNVKCRSIAADERANALR